MVNIKNIHTNLANIQERCSYSHQNAGKASDSFGNKYLKNSTYMIYTYTVYAQSNKFTLHVLNSHTCCILTLSLPHVKM